MAQKASCYWENFSFNLTDDLQIGDIADRRSCEMECQIFRNNSREIRNLLRENTSRAKCVVSSACAEGKHSKTRRLSRDTFSRVRHQLNIASRVTLLNNLHPPTIIPPGQNIWRKCHTLNSASFQPLPCCKNIK